MDETLLTTGEYADLVGVTRRTVQRWIAEGKIFAVKIGRGYKIPSDEQPPFEPSDERDPDEDEEEELYSNPEAEFGPIGFDPEEPDEEEEEANTDYPVEVASFGQFDEEELRRIQATLGDAIAYADSMPILKDDISIIIDPVMMLYRVRINYKG